MHPQSLVGGSAAAAAARRQWGWVLLCEVPTIVLCISGSMAQPVGSCYPFCPFFLYGGACNSCGCQLFSHYVYHAPWSCSCGSFAFLIWLPNIILAYLAAWASASYRSERVVLKQSLPSFARPMMPCIVIPCLSCSFISVTLTLQPPALTSHTSDEPCL